MRLFHLASNSPTSYRRYTPGGILIGILYSPARAVHTSTRNSKKKELAKTASSAAPAAPRAITARMAAPDQIPGQEYEYALSLFSNIFELFICSLRKMKVEAER